MSLWWYDGAGTAPPAEKTRGLVATFGKVPQNGCLILGDKGILFTDPWGCGGVMKLNSE